MRKRWTKRRQRAQELICDSLSGRIQLHHTSYNRSHDRTGRCWITIDGMEVLNACYLNFQVRHYKLATDIQEMNHCSDYTDTEQRPGYFQASDDAERILHRQGVFSEYDFLTAIDEWTNTSIDGALASDNDLVRGFAMIDRRLGKRRLKQIVLLPQEPPIIHKLYELRCSAEGMRVETRTSQSSN